MEYLVIGFYAEIAFIGSRCIELLRFDAGEVQYNNKKLKEKVEDFLNREFSGFPDQILIVHDDEVIIHWKCDRDEEMENGKTIPIWEE